MIKHYEMLDDEGNWWHVPADIAQDVWDKARAFGLNPRRVEYPIINAADRSWADIVESPLGRTLTLMVSIGEAPDYRRAKALITTMFGAAPTAEELRTYRRSLGYK